MPRRAGKAASRRARQRAAQRGAGRAATPPAPTSRREPTVTASPVPPVGTPDAREAVALDPPRRVSPPPAVLGDSRLSGHDRAEYHYVERDLRNIAILTALMVAILLVAWVVFLSTGLTT